MKHFICSVTSATLAGPHSLRLSFDDGTQRVVDFAPVLRGELYGPLRDPAFFAQVKVDPEVRTLVWPNGADFDPATLHNWPEHVQALGRLAAAW